MKRLATTVVAAATVALIGSAAPLQASPITYSISGVGSGLFDGATFTNDLVTFTLTGDTDNITTLAPGVIMNPGTSMTADVEGLGQDDITGPSFAAFTPDFFDSGAGVAVLVAQEGADVGPLAILSTDPAFLAYTLSAATSFGPITGVGAGSTPDGSAVFDTSRGSFQWSSVPTTSTFTARTVPEPSSFAMLGLGVATLFGLGFARRQRA